MILWLDAQLPPHMAVWAANLDGVESAIALRELGLRDATDIEIFAAAREAAVTLVSKDSDFVDLVQRLGPPPRLIWVTLGNVTNARLRSSVIAAWPQVATLLEAGEPIVELG